MVRRVSIATLLLALIAAAVPAAKLGDVQRALHAAFVASRPPSR